MVRILITIAALALGGACFGAPVIIEDFENTNDPANIQLSAVANHTLNATITGNTPQYVTSGTGNLAGRFAGTWVLDSAATGTANPYDMAGPLKFWAARFNFNAPSSLPNNSLPTSSALLQADLVNNGSDPVLVSFVVMSAQSSQLERGPLVAVPAGAGLTYSWDFASVPPVGFDTGDGVFTGPVQRVKSLLLYSPTLPGSSTFSVTVDNIRNGNGTVTTAPATALPVPEAVSLLQGASAGQAILSWTAPANPTVTGFNIYVAQDANFGVPSVNRLTFPTTPALTVTGSARSATLTGLPANTPVYVTVAATDGSNESSMARVLAVNLTGNGTQPGNRLVLNGTAFGPSDPEYVSDGYFHAAVYTAQAFGSTNSFDTVSADAVASGIVSLTPNADGVVVWSALEDGLNGPSISPANLARIAAFLNSDGNLIVSGNHLASDLDSRGVLENSMHARLVEAGAPVSDVTPVRGLAAASPFSVACSPVLNEVAFASSNNDLIMPTTDGIEQALYAGIPRLYAVAGVGYQQKLVFLAFAFESVGDAAVPAQSQVHRAELLQAMMNYLLVPTAACDWQLYAE